MPTFVKRVKENNSDFGDFELIECSKRVIKNPRNSEAELQGLVFCFWFCFCFFFLAELLDVITALPHLTH